MIINKNSMYKPTSITFDDETLKRGQALARATKVTLSAMVRMCVNQAFVADQQKQRAEGVR